MLIKCFKYLNYWQMNRNKIETRWHTFCCWTISRPYNSWWAFRTSSWFWFIKLMWTDWEFSAIHILSSFNSSWWLWNTLYERKFGCSYLKKKDNKFNELFNLIKSSSIKPGVAFCDFLLICAVIDFNLSSRSYFNLI